MQLERLTLDRFRCFSSVQWQPEPGINLIVGDNGVGKTSLLEAAHLLANGRSFRGRVRDGLVRHGDESLEIFAQWREGENRNRRAGLRHSGRDWQARLDGQVVASLAELCTALAVLSFEPGSHALVSGGSEARRRCIDWALFHVEPEFLAVWRRCARAIKQRNALLKARPRAADLDPWDHELAVAGEAITRMRALYLAKLEPYLADNLTRFVPELGPFALEFLPGWKRDSQPLLSALAQARERDLALGHGSVGPHRADWRLAFERLPDWSVVSRGQEKLVALSCVLAQARCHAASRGEWPVIAFDDLGSELDGEHQSRVLQDLATSGAQVLVTGTAIPSTMTAANATVFHVEHGQIRRRN